MCNFAGTISKHPKYPRRSFHVISELTRESADIDGGGGDRGRRTTCIARKPKRRSRRALAYRVLRWGERYYSRGIQMRRHESRESFDAVRLPCIPTSEHGERGGESRARSLARSRRRRSLVEPLRPSGSRHRAGVLLNQSGRSVGTIRTCRQVDSSPRAQRRAQERPRDRAAIGRLKKKNSRDRRRHECHARADRSFPRLVTMSDQRELDTTADVINKPRAGSIGPPRTLIADTCASFNSYTPEDKYTFRRDRC